MLALMRFQYGKIYLSKLKTVLTVQRLISLTKVYIVKNESRMLDKSAQRASPKNL